MAEAAPGLSFPRDTFARLTPGPFLLAHLKQADCSLSHSNGSAVVRMGDTAVVCGVRGEILLASDIPHPPDEDTTSSATVEDLGLIVPNVELSTGCSPSHLPGNPPTSLAQSLSHRVSALLNNSNAIELADLSIKHTEPQTAGHLPDKEPKIVTKAYWALYVDILCLALDGNAFDAAWLAVAAALQDTVLPRAWWDQDQEMILCSPLSSESSRLSFPGLCVASTFAAFSTASPLKQRDAAQSWILADPDAFEEDLCDETVTVVLSPASESGRSIMRIERSGGSVIGKDAMKQCVQHAEKHCQQLEASLQAR
ncbi:hypothetical protein AC579_8992 [Pseudocercospora musae]|uniref:Ribosomal RNA-processing protein 43 n=1 Tax=Pseudocercospora musae TaxID=113226 RepID=A0A139I8K1_9PEZI|nr:hypothetical protein AC579_8992 [Pseudocercospora musae]